MRPKRDAVEYEAEFCDDADYLTRKAAEERTVAWGFALALLIVTMFGLGWWAGRHAARQAQAAPGVTESTNAR